MKSRNPRSEIGRQRTAVGNPLCGLLSGLLFVAALVHAEAPPALQTATLPSGAGAALLDPATATHVAASAVNAGQLAGRGLDGLELQDPDDLLPLIVQSLLIRTAGGESVLLDGNGVYSLRVASGGFSFLNAQGEPEGEVTSWAEALNQVDWSAVTNLPPRQVLLGTQIEDGLIRPRHLGFSVTAAVGGEGAVQYNAAGELAGTGNVFIQADARLGVRVQSRNIQRVYKGEDPADENLLYRLRRGQRIATLSFYKNGEETVTLSGDGVLRLKGIETAGLSLGSNTVSAAQVTATSFTLGGQTITEWPTGGIVDDRHFAKLDAANTFTAPATFQQPVWISPAGDLSMGSYTNAP